MYSTNRTRAAVLCIMQGACTLGCHGVQSSLCCVCCSWSTGWAGGMCVPCWCWPRGCQASGRCGVRAVVQHVQPGSGDAVCLARCQAACFPTGLPATASCCKQPTGVLVACQAPSVQDFVYAGVLLNVRHSVAWRVCGLAFVCVLCYACLLLRACWYLAGAV
ncbi:hypothetical protein COO60DRAFT_230286 [Scenedesmus sp. NREL 46B-D3]|nr:hypothetical protein COO60DRAFT_230286 [Scenedesmus sp. NREL 46B-D3]